MEKGLVIMVKWPPRSPDLSLCDFFLWGNVKGLVFKPPLPANIEEMKLNYSCTGNCYQR